MTALPTALRHLLQSPTRPETLSLTDRELLARFSGQDEEAFTVLVRRHAALVFGVCRRVLGNTHDAEDAFQATFLALARRASATNWRESVAGWLHDVAWRLATQARIGTARRRHHESQYGHSSLVLPESVAEDLGRVLDEELARLPEEYRTPLILCYRQGQTCAAAARQVGCSLRTLHRRLERGRGVLRARLTRRGLVSAFALAGLTETTAAAPPALTCAAIQVGVAGRSGCADRIPGPVRALADGLRSGAAVLRMKLTALFLLVVTLATGSVVLALSSKEGKTGPPLPGNAPKEGKSPAAQTDRHGDPLPKGAVSRLGTLCLHGRSGTLAFSPDGKLLAGITSGNAPGEVVLWDRVTGRLIRRIRGNHLTSVAALSFSPDGKRLACSTHSLRCPVLEVATGKVLYSCPGAHPHAAFTGDGRLLVSADSWGNQPRVRLWDARTGKAVGRWPLGKGVEAMSLASEGNTLAVLNYDDPVVVRVLQIRTGKEIWRLKAPEAGRFHFTLSPDGEFLGLAGRRGVFLWDITTGKQTHAWKQRSDSAVVFSADGKRLAWSGYGPGIAHAWTVRRDEARPHAVGGPTNCFQPPALSRDGKVLAIPTDGRAVVLRDPETGKELCPLEAHASPVYQVASSDGRVLVSRDRSEIIAWDWPTGRLLRRHPTEPLSGEVPLQPLPGGRMLCRSPEGIVRMREADSGRERVRLEGVQQKAVVVISEDGNSAAFYGKDGWLHVFDLSTGKSRFRVEHLGDPYRVGLSANGRCLIQFFTQGEKTRIAVTDTQSGKVWQLPKDDVLRGQLPFWVNPSCLSPDGRYLVLPGPPGQLRRWDVLGKTDVPPLRSGLRNTFEIFFSPDGRLVGCRGDEGEPGVLNDSPDRPRIQVRVWDLTTGRRLAHLDPKPSGNERPVFSPDGGTLLTTSGGTIYLWEVATGQERGRFSGHLGSGITALTFSPDGRTLFSGGDDAQVLAWDLTGSGGNARPAASADQLGHCWKALAGRDARAAYLALWTLVAEPASSLPFLREHLRPIPHLAPARVARLIAALDSERFATRRQAARELEALGEPVAEHLRKALTRPPTLESRRRLEQLLEQVTSPLPTGPRLQALRAIEALEHLGTAEARKLLRELAGGAPGALRTRAARESLGRLESGNYRR
jgi:RNA polymerase sigma factor (sigma-70 family)